MSVYTSLAEEVYQTPELAMIIHEYCDIGILANIASCNRANRAQILYILTKRIHALLSRYIPAAELFNFFTALDDAHGAISGSIPLAIFQPSTFPYWEPRNLNIFVPWQEIRTMAQFLRSIGYAKDSDCRIPFRWYHLVRRHINFRKVGHPDVFLSESYDETVLPIILGTSTTAMMNAFTSTTYYSFYPNMTSRREVIPNWPGPIAGDKDKFKARGYTFFDYAPRAGPLQCGQGCALEARRVRGRRGIGVLTFSASHENSAKLDEDPIVWQLGEECPYHHCQNRSKAGLPGQR